MSGVVGAWLSADVFLAVWSGDATDVRIDSATASSVESRRIVHGDSHVLLMQVGPASARGRSAGTTPFDLGGLTVDLRTLCREQLAAADAEARSRLMEFLTTALGWTHDGSARVELGRHLLLAREALRERLPYAPSAAGDVPRVLVDAIVAADDRTFVVTGAMSDDVAAVSSLMAVSPEGLREDLRPSICLHAHHRGLWGSPGGGQGGNPAGAGFTAFCTLEAPSVLDEGWRLELRSATRDDVEVKAPRVVRDLAGARRALLPVLGGAHEPDEALRELVFGGLDGLQCRLRAAARVEHVAQFGAPPASPEISIVIALGRRADRIEHQLAQFARDPELQGADVIYLDDASAARERLAERAADLYELYRVPFRLATLEGYAGFAAAIDAGTSLARASFLVLLTPEALPARPGWLSTLAACHRHQPDTGVVVPQWLDVNGMPRAQSPQPGAACLGIDRAVLLEMGGLSGRYAQDDAEAEDLCLRLVRRGRRIVTCDDVELYLLRDDAESGSQRLAETRYDTWVCQMRADTL